MSYTELYTKMSYQQSVVGLYTWYTGCAFKRDWELRALETTRITFVDKLIKNFDVQMASDVLAYPTGEGEGRAWWRLAIQGGH